MKKILSIITLSAFVAVLMISCKQSTVTAFPAAGPDTAGLAQFQAWKAMNAQIEAQQLIAASTPAPVAVKKQSSSKSSGSMTSSTTNNAKAKKGWSKAAKYSAIGGGTGIVLGAVINKKNRVVGGILGGVLGGGIGYGIGRSQDKKDGRVQ